MKCNFFCRMMLHGMKTTGVTLRANSLHSRKNSKPMCFLCFMISVTHKRFFCRLHDDKFGNDIYLAFNAHDYFVKAAIPAPPHKKQWHRVVWCLLCSLFMHLKFNSFIHNELLHDDYILKKHLMEIARFRSVWNEYR